MPHAYATGRHPSTRATLTVLVGTAVLMTAATPALATGRAAAATRHQTISTVTTSLGRILANGKGRVVYLFEKDGHNKSRCGSDCRSIWPRVMSKAKPKAAGGVRASHLGRLKSGQVTYYGHPLYYYVGDNGRAQHHGEGLFEFGAKWYAVSVNGQANKGGAHSSTAPPPTQTPNGAATVQLRTTSSYGQVLASGNGHSLYILDTDGTTQVSYNGHPVYDYSGDFAAGDTNGEGSEGVWHLVDANGDAVTGPTGPAPYPY